MKYYIVYHIKSTMQEKTFALESAAKRSTTCLNRKKGSVQYAYADNETYNTDVVSMKKVRNSMTGEEIEIPSNTPRSCDPSSELYWTM